MGNQHPHTDSSILVTGVSGYISSYVAKMLLEKGYKVRGTVRSLDNKHKTQHLLTLPNQQNLTLIEADLSNDNCWDDAVNGCQYVIHIASPVPPYTPTDQNEVVKPAVEGAKNVLNAAIKHKVKRFIFTSSCMTLSNGDTGKVLNEEMWEDPSTCAAYPKSKILAEKAVWDIYKAQNLQKDHTEVVAVLPCLVLGPGLTVHQNSSEVLITEVMRGSYPGIPESDIIYSVVDVRDAALGHCLALFKPDIDGQRIALAGSQVRMSEIIHILHQNFPDNPIKMNKVSVEEMRASNNKIALRNIDLLGKKIDVDNSKSKQKLGMEYRPVKETIVDMGNQLQKLKVVP